jgi:hypothetical protein
VLGLGGQELLPCRPAAARSGSIPARFRIFHTVEAEIWWPRRVSSPWLRR